MEWRRTYGYATRSRGLNGINNNMGMNIAPLKKQTINTNQETRKFGTELTSNILNNQKNKIKIQVNKKRTFSQLNADEKEEENSKQYNDKYEQPAKRFRYNLRSRGPSRGVSTEILGNVNINKIYKQNKEIKKKKTMEIDSETDEDIDLKPNKKQIKKPNNKQIKKQFPPRRSLRLKNKRIKNLNKKKHKNKNQKKVVKQIVKKLEYIVDSNYSECDLFNCDNDLMVIDYVNDIMKWYIKCENSLEQKNLIRNGYISSSFQSDLNESMRCILLNWLLNIHRRFKLLDRSLFLGIYIFDAYLSLVAIKRDELQLIGCASMWIASKYHEIYAPEANDFAYISDYSFNISALFETEIKILTKLQFRFANIITPLNFIERYLQIATFPIYKKYKNRGTIKAINDGNKWADLLKQLTHFFIELSLFDCKLISTQKPSIIAAGSLCFAILSISLYSQWPVFLQNETNYTYKQLLPILIRLSQLKTLSDKKKINSVAKKHPAIKTWLDKLNINAVLNNK